MDVDSITNSIMNSLMSSIMSKNNYEEQFLVAGKAIFCLRIDSERLRSEILFRGFYQLLQKWLKYYEQPLLDSAAIYFVSAMNKANKMFALIDDFKKFNSLDSIDKQEKFLNNVLIRDRLISRPILFIK